MPEPLKFCKDCAHYTIVEAFVPNEFKNRLGERRLPMEHMCVRPITDVVTGKSLPLNRGCYEQRSDSGGPCGTYAAYFIPKI